MNSGPHTGHVVAVDDPEGRGRVRVEIPGIADASAWAMPLVPGAGRKRGLYAVPDIGAEVMVLFVGGDPEEIFYAPSWGAGDVPDEAGGSPQVFVLASEHYVVVLDDRVPQLSIRHRASGDGIQHNGSTRAMTVSSTTSISIEATGRVAISGAVVTLQGRPVGPGGSI